MMDVTSSTAQASNALAVAVTKINLRLFKLGMDTINWTIQVKNPRSRNAPTMTIMPTRNMITSSEDEVIKVGISIDLLKINTANPRKATANRKPQKKSVPKMMEIKTAQAVDCAEVIAPDATPPKPINPAAASMMQKRETMYFADILPAEEVSLIIINPKRV